MKIKNLLLAATTTATLGVIGTTAISASASTSASNVYRLYNKNTGEHFYTESAYEKGMLASQGWNYEGVGWKSAMSGAPVYRVYNPNARGGDHYYTLSKYEAQSLVNKGWQWDNNGKAVFYSAGSVNLYVAYNPNAQSGSHNYTTNTYEQNSLLGSGWKYGAVAWKTVGSGDTTGEDNGNKPEPVEKFTVWYEGSETSEFDIKEGTKIFATHDEAVTWIEQYADDLLDKGITAKSYGSMSVYI